MEERALESARLARSLELIGREKAAMEEKRDQLDEQVKLMRTRVGGTYDNDLMVQEFILQRVRRQALELAMAQGAPYFSRVDFAPSGEDPETHYIGKHGVMDSQTLRDEVVDWRSPIANLYYAGQVGDAHYETPEGLVDGHLSLKRMFTIQDGALLHVLDVDLMTQDRLLADALSQVTTDRLREVVTTIQAEQNAIIRHPLRTPLIVQGVAGSGKTTIALHRIAYLLYAHADMLAPQQLMILAPNPLFLRYISAVLPDLGVENVRQTTFARLALELLGKAAPKLSPGERLDELLDDPQRAEEVRQVSRRKGSLAFGEALREYLSRLEDIAAPDQDVRFGPALLMTGEEARRMFLQDLRHFPLSRRQEELRKVLGVRLKNRGVPGLRAAIEEACDKRAQVLRTLPEGPERRERMGALYQSRDRHLQEVEAQAKAFLKGLPSLWPKLTPVDIYRAFLERSGLPAPQGKVLQAEDLPALLLIQDKLGGLSDRSITHIVIDEAQDFSPLAIRALGDIYGCGFTLVGDMGQGIYRYRGMDAWEEALPALPLCQIKLLRASYRSTVEIMSFANEIALRHPYPGQVLAQPVLRHGEPPVRIAVSSERERILAVADEAARYQELGMHAIAILARDDAAARKLHKALQKLGLHISLLRPEGEEYQGGLLVAAATAVKGLEFDAVIVENAASFPEDATGSRLLYVCVTRALHYVTLVVPDCSDLVPNCI